MPDQQVSSAVVLAALKRIEENQTTHAERLDAHGARLDAHDHTLRVVYEQLQAHSAMLLKHAELHTRHAETISAAKESAREAKQSSSDLAEEWKRAASAIDRHVKAGLDGVHTEMTKAKEERALQTSILRKVASAVPARQLALAATIGAFVGGLLFGVVYALVSHFLGGGHP